MDVCGLESAPGCGFDLEIEVDTDLGLDIDLDLELGSRYWGTCCRKYECSDTSNSYTPPKSDDNEIDPACLHNDM